MRRPFLLALVLLSLLLVAVGVVLSLQQRATPPPTTRPDPAALDAVPRITIDALLGQLQTSNPPLVWDIRPVSAFTAGHIPGSRPLSLDGLPAAAANVDKRQQIVTLCA